MAASTTVCGELTADMVRALSLGPVARPTSESSKMIDATAAVRSATQTSQSMMAIGAMIRKMVRENSNGRAVQGSKAGSVMTRCMVMVRLPGRAVPALRVNGAITRRTERER